MSKLPAFQFYPADWRKDPGVQSLSYHDRGVWFEMLCLMHESQQRGVLLLNGDPMPEDALARLLGLDKQNLTKTLTTLLAYGVCERDAQSGALVNRRMVRDESIRRVRSECGKLGGNPSLLNQNDKQKPTTGVKQNSTPSSSTSSSGRSSPVLSVGDVEISLSGARGREALEVFAGVYGHPPHPLGQGEIEATVAAAGDGWDLDLWRDILRQCKSNLTPVKNVGTMTKMYRERASRVADDEWRRAIRAVPQPPAGRLPDEMKTRAPTLEELMETYDVDDPDEARRRWPGVKSRSEAA